ncbi:hypothetical protein ACFY74_11995 [Streptomyces massasporeus]|uniref:hypothetical protein n=1 Tax=Streptomyces massasporeus TaxID=67324 RepID=UPI00368A58EE
MTREERRALLGDDVITHIHECVAAAPEPTSEVVESLRRILTHPAGCIAEPAPAADAA